jgi:hypothetical protein
MQPELQVLESTNTSDADVSTFDDINRFRGEDFWRGKAQIKNYKVAGTPQKHSLSD